MIHLPPIIDLLAWLLPTAAGIIILIRLRDQYHSQEWATSFFSYILKEIHITYFSQTRRGIFFPVCIINAIILALWFAWSVPLVANPVSPTLLLISILLLSDQPLVEGLDGSNDSERQLVRRLVFICLAGMVSVIIVGFILRFQFDDPSQVGMDLINGQMFLLGLAGKLGMGVMASYLNSRHRFQP